MPARGISWESQIRDAMSLFHVLRQSHFNGSLEVLREEYSQIVSIHRSRVILTGVMELLALDIPQAEPTPHVEFETKVFNGKPKKGHIRRD